MSTEEKINILLVDDRPQNLLAMESILSEPGVNIMVLPAFVWMLSPSCNPPLFPP